MHQFITVFDLLLSQPIIFVNMFTTSPVSFKQELRSFSLTKWLHSESAKPMVSVL